MFLRRAGRADPDSQYGDAGMGRLEPRYQPCLGAGAAGSVDQVMYVQVLLIGLVQ